MHQPSFFWLYCVKHELCTSISYAIRWLPGGEEISSNVVYFLFIAKFALPRKVRIVRSPSPRSGFLDRNPRLMRLALHKRF